MSARGWADRLSGGPSDPGSERPDPGPGFPVRSNGPDPTPPGPTLRPRPPVPEPHGSALRVVLVSRDNMLAGALRSLIEAPGGVRMLDWHSDELDGAIRHADVVVVDMPPNLHERAFDVIDGRFLGRTVVLLQEGEHAEALPAGPPRAVLYRPLQIAELWAAVTGAQPGAPFAPDPEAGGPEAADPGSGAQDHAGGADDPGAEAGTGSDDDPGAGTGDEAAAMPGPGLPVAESGLLIGLSGRELEPVIGPGQVAPGMDEETLERLRRWGNRGGQPASGTAGARRANGTRAVGPSRPASRPAASCPAASEPPRRRREPPPARRPPASARPARPPASRPARPGKWSARPPRKPPARPVGAAPRRRPAPGSGPA